MKMKKVAIQKDLEDIKTLLLGEGYEVVYMGENDSDCGITIMSGVDEEYSGLEHSQCMYNGDKEHQMLVINVGSLTPEQVVNLVKKNSC